MNITTFIMHIIDRFIYDDEVGITYFINFIIHLIIDIILLLLLLL